LAVQLGKQRRVDQRLAGEQLAGGDEQRIAYLRHAVGRLRVVHGREDGLAQRELLPLGSDRWPLQ